MQTRSVRLPWSIKLVLAGYLVGLPMRAFAAANVLRIAHPSPIWYVLNGFELVLIVYEAAALWRMSRWAPIVQAAAVIGFTINRFIQDPSWTQRYPLLGIFAVIGPSLIYFALVLPHWRKMNWAPFGLSYRAPSDIDFEVF